MSNAHKITSISYICTICRADYNNINSIRAHYNTCKKKLENANEQAQVDMDSVTVGHDSSLLLMLSCDNRIMDNDTDDDRGKNDRIKLNVDNIDTATRMNKNEQTVIDYKCQECIKLNEQFIATDKKKWTNHMRVKHPAAYERSKTVARKRIEWLTDEDWTLTLAALEIKLKKESKGQILNRLVREWNKLVRTAGAKVRSKGAIIGRRQSPQYKIIFTELMNEMAHDSSGNDMAIVNERKNEEYEKEQVDGYDNLPDYISYESRIREYISQHYLDTDLQLSDATKQLIIKFINNKNDPNIVATSYDMIKQALDEGQKETTPKNRIPKYNNRLKMCKQIRNKSKRQKAETYKMYQSMYYKDKAKLISSLLDGITVDTQPPPISTAISHYQNIWSVNINDNGVNPWEKYHDLEKLFFLHFSLFFW